MDLLNRLWHNPATGFVGKEKLYRQAKAINPGITRKQVGEFFAQNETAQTHSKPLKKDKGQPIRGPLGSIQMDLMFYPYPKQNKGYNTILTAVGINNRIGYAIPMKNKSASESARAVQELIDQATKNGHPFYLVESDNGKEFLNKSVQAVFAKYDINHITGQEGDHNFMGLIERFNRTIKAMIGKYMTANNTTKWIDILPQIINNYNGSIHSSIKVEPNSVDTKKEKQIMDDSFVDAFDRVSSIDIQIGDKVRLPNQKGPFQKEGQNFSNAIYTVDTISWSRITVRNEGGHLLKKNYRIAEVLKVPSNSQSVNTSQIKSARKEAKVGRILKKEGVDQRNAIPRAKRTAAKNSQAINKILAEK